MLIIFSILVKSFKSSGVNNIPGSYIEYGFSIVVKSVKSKNIRPIPTLPCIILFFTRYDIASLFSF